MIVSFAMTLGKSSLVALCPQNREGPTGERSFPAPALPSATGTPSYPSCQIYTSLGNAAKVQVHTMKPSYLAACSCSSFPARSISCDAGLLVYTFCSLNNCYGSRFAKNYVSQDRICADAIRGYRLTYGQLSSFEEVICIIACN